MDSNLEFKKIKSIKRVKKKQKVYNFNVPNYESYVANGFVVHNCENHKISQTSPTESSQVILPSKLMEIAIEKHCQSVSMSYNEPILSYEYLITIAEESALNRLQFALKTNAFVNRDPWKEICKRTHAMNIDLKAGTKECFKSMTGCSRYVTRDRIKEAYESGVHLEISIPLYYRDDKIEEEIKIVGEFLSSLDKEIPCHLLSIQPSHEYGNFIFNSENMSRAKNILSNYMNNIYEVD